MLCWTHIRAVVMKQRSILSRASMGLCAPLYASKFETLQRGLYVITKNNPDLGYTILGYTVDLFVICIVISIISGIVSIIIKNVFELNRDETVGVFTGIGLFMLITCLILYFS